MYKPYPKTHPTFVFRFSHYDFDDNGNGLGLRMMVEKPTKVEMMNGQLQTFTTKQEDYINAQSISTVTMDGSGNRSKS